MKKIFAGIFSLMIALMSFGLTTYAAENASISIGAESGSVGVGDTVSVTVSISASSVIVGGEIWLSYDSSVLDFIESGFSKGGGGNIKLSNAGETSYTLSFRAKSIGTASISVNTGKTVLAIGAEIQSSVSGGGCSVTVAAPVTYSTDNNLASLSISPGTLSPAFSPSVTTYTTSVGADCSQLVVSAVANDGNASVSVSGTKLDPGSNTTTITVTAQSGATKTYTIHTTKASKEEESTNADEKESETESSAVEQPVKVDGNAYKVIADLTEHPLPSGYELIDYDYNGTTIQAGKGTNTKLTLVYLESTDEKGQSGFYIYDSVAKTFTPYMEVSQPEITYVILPITDSMEKPAGLSLTDYNINGMTAKVMMSADRSYCVFYGVSSTGVTGWFRYDCKDKTIQSYNVANAGDNVLVSTETSTKSDKSLKVWQLIALGTSGIAIAMVITVIILASKLSKNKKAFMAATGEYHSGDFDEEDLEQVMFQDEEDILAEAEQDSIDESDDDYEELELFDLDEKKKN